MTRVFPLFLTALLLLQILGPELLVVSYALNRAQITVRFCVNKARPILHCNGQCHLAQQLRQAEDLDKKVPAGSVPKIKYEVLSTSAPVLRVPRRWPRQAQRYPAVHWTVVPAPGVFRPPLDIA